MKQETIDGNRLIAEFMGASHVVDGDLMYNKESQFYCGLYACPVNQLLYNSSWDWLMPVVGKIEEQGQSVSIFRGCCDIRFDKIKEGEEEPEPIESGGGQPKIVSVWQSVVRYIQWYNTQNSNA